MKLRSMPSQKERKRYVFFRLRSSAGLEFNDVRNAVMNSMLNWMEKAGSRKRSRGSSGTCGARKKA